MDADVLICGLGPVGQTLAHLLGGLGVNVVAIDAADGPYDLPRAAVIDDEVLRTMQAIGLDAEVLRDAQVQTGVSYVTAGGRPVEVLRPLRGALGQPPLVSIHQPSLERTLVAGLAGRPTVEVRWSRRLLGLDQDGEGVRASVAAGEGEATTIAARFAVGCDGAASAVRRGLGVEFGGSTFAQRWLVVDVAVAAPLSRVPHPYFVGHAGGPIVSLPMSPGRHRWEWMARPGESDADLLDPATIDARVGEWLEPGESAAVERAVVYTFHARTAARWRLGRVLLAGDAAHVMPPFAGQGLSSGVRDAANLAWKLEAVLRGAPPSLLNSYEQERRPQVRAMQNLAVRWGAVVQTARPRLARSRDRLMGALDGTAAQRWLQGNLKPLPTYRRGAFARRPHPLPPLRGVGGLFPQPTVALPGGERLRLDDALPAGWVGLAADAGAAGALREGGLTTLDLGADLDDVDGEVGSWLRRQRASWVLLRPDRYVFACGAGTPAAALASMRRQIGSAAAGVHPDPAPAEAAR